VIDKIKRIVIWFKATDFLVGLTFFFISLLFFYDLFKDKFLLIERDLGPYFIPPRFFWLESIKKGDFPLWNPYQFSGHPFFANPQHAILYPFNGLFFLLPFDISFNIIILLHFFLGGLFTYLLLKDLRVNSSGALISGLIFMLSGYLLSVHSLLTILLSSVWTPLIMMFFRRAIYREGIKNEMVTSFLITFSFLGGGIEIVYGNFFVLLIMVIFSPFPSVASTGDKPRRYQFFSDIPIDCKRMKPIFKRFGSLLIITILFLFLSAIQLFPFVELFHHSTRVNGISFQEATIWSFAPKDILLFFLPDAYGYFLDMKKYWINQCWFKTLYTGGLPFILSLIFFLTPYFPFFPQKERKGFQPPIEITIERADGVGNGRILYLVLMLFSLFLSLGKYNPFYPFVFNYVPFFNGIRYPAKFLYIFILILSITAGLGFQRLIELSEENKPKRYKNFLIILSLAWCVLLLFLILGNKEIEHSLNLREINFPKFNYLSVNLFHAKRFIFYLALFFLLIRVGDEVKWKSWTKGLLIFFLATDLFGNIGFYGKERTLDYFQKTKILEMISSDRDYFRVFTTAKTISQETTILIGDPTSLNIFKEKHLPSMSLLYRLHDIWGIEVIRPKRVDDLYQLFTSTPSISETHLVNLYGIKYVISITPLEGASCFELIYTRIEGLQGKREDLDKENTIKLYKNRKPILRGWLVKDFKVMDSKAILTRMVNKDFCPEREVLFEKEPPHLVPLIKEGKGEVEVISETNNRLRLLVKTPESTFLVINDTYFPGWKAFVDGGKTEIIRADYTFRAIPLHAGTHQVEFVYDPMSFKLGTLFSFLGLIGCVIMTSVSRCKNRPRPTKRR
jgi:hypothetical protein